MISTFLKKAIEEARKSDHKHKIGAVIFNKKTIISIGRNYTTKSVKHLHPRFKKQYYNTVHAEVDAIIKARRDIVGCSILIIRVNKKGDLLLAKPCDHCQTYINYVGLKTMCYSDDNVIRKVKL